MFGIVHSDRAPVASQFYKNHWQLRQQNMLNSMHWLYFIVQKLPVTTPVKYAQ
jgi:hypothetical protein